MPVNIQRRAFIAGSAAFAAWPRNLFATVPAELASAWEKADGGRLMEFGETTAMRDEQSLALFDVMDRMQGWTEE